MNKWVNSTYILIQPTSNNEKEIIGTKEELSNIIGCCNDYIIRAARLKTKIKNHKVKIWDRYIKYNAYSLYDTEQDKLISINGRSYFCVKELSDLLGYSEQSTRRISKDGQVCFVFDLDSWVLIKEEPAITVRKYLYKNGEKVNYYESGCYD